MIHADGGSVEKMSGRNRLEYSTGFDLLHSTGVQIRLLPRNGDRNICAHLPLDPVGGKAEQEIIVTRTLFLHRIGGDAKGKTAFPGGCEIKREIYSCRFPTGGQVYMEASAHLCILRVSQNNFKC